jgi:hypothetical protein
MTSLHMAMLPVPWQRVQRFGVWVWVALVLLLLPSLLRFICFSLHCQ